MGNAFKCVEPKQTQTASWGNRHCASSALGGKPQNALQWTGEGEFAICNKDKIFTEDLDMDLKVLMFIINL